MRYIDISKLDILKLQQRVNDKRNWKCIKDDLACLSNNMCWYCEHYVTSTGYPEVDHWRPKCIYGWLEYDVCNYIYTCKACNNKKHESFPLKNDENRATCLSDNINLEEPLFLDPRNKDDIKSVSYDESGILVAKKENAIEKVKRTTDKLGLRTEERIRVKRQAIRDLINDLEILLLINMPNTNAFNKLIEKINNKIKYSKDNQFVWTLCMFLIRWFKEHVEESIKIRPYINFPPDFAEVYINS